MLVKKTVKSARAQYRRSPVWRRLHPRRFHAYCAGSPKSGTHSIAALFYKNYRAKHEPESLHLIDMILAKVNGTVGEGEFAEYVRARDKRLWLEFDSSHLNYFLLDILVSEFDDAKFILTIRDCYSWLDSVMNHALGKPHSERWRQLTRYKNKVENFRYADEERFLAERGLNPLDAYLSNWANHNQKVINAVPKDRLLVIRTHEISKEIGRIADFVGVPAESLDRANAHAYKARQSFDILSQLDPGFLEAKVNTHCKDLMSTYFPEKSSLERLL